MEKFCLILLVVLSQHCSILECKEARSHYKVLILGAGLSGIVAGKTLLDNGIDDFLILEGQNYIGGRIKQGNIGGLKVEQGANWIHFVEEEDTLPIWKLKLQHKIKGLTSNYSAFIIRDENGNDKTDLKSYKAFMKALSNIESAPENRPKNDVLTARVWLGLNGWKPSTPAQYAIEYFEIDFESGKSLEFLPYTALFEKGKDFFITDQRGVWSLYQDFVDEVKEHIRLRKVVKSVNYNGDFATVVTRRGEVYTADLVLCTFSNGVLASDMVRFTPPLPLSKQEVILKQPMSVYTKVFLKFPRKFWDDKEFILHAGTTRQSLAVFQDLERPGIFPPGSGILLITFTGEEGRRIEKQSRKKTAREMYKMLKDVYGRDIPRPTDIFYGRWSQNQFIRGSYSESTPGVNEKTFEELQANVKNVYFSGEGTSGDWYGYMQGSFLTGEKQAKRIVAELKRRFKN